MRENIEDNLEATTVNEVLLLNRIRELHRNRLMNVNSFDFHKAPTGDYDMKISMDAHALYMVAEGTVEEDWRGFTIGARSTGFRDKNLNIAYRQFVDKTVFDNMWNKYQVVNLLGELHKNVIHKLASHVEKN